MNRRELLSLFRSGLLGSLPAACLRATGASGGGLQPDFDFADLALQWAASRLPAVRAQLETHPALAALVRHQQLSGNAAASAPSLLDTVLQAGVDGPAAAQVLQWARDHRARLARASQAALDLLPGAARFHGHVYFVTGYDIGVAAPPDVAINVAHPHFVASPAELEHYITHEAHHVGFLGVRSAPRLEQLDDPSNLLAVVRFFTQMEGMAVHAAYEPRRRAGALGGEADYDVYRDARRSRAVVSRYREVIAPLHRGRPVGDHEIGAALEAMSSGERLWYRFGAVVCSTVESAGGRDVLIASIADPDIFDRAADELLA